MRAWLLCLLLVGCAGPQLLPSTIFHAPMGAEVAPSNDDWVRLGRAHDAGASSIAATTPISDDEWLVWLVDADDHGTIVRARRTPLGLEAQSSGAHAGPSVRASVRTLVVAGTRFVIVESSTSEESTEREAWLYAEHGAQIVALSLDGDAGRIRVRAERRTSLERGWSRVATLTATFEASDTGLVVHEHASVREVAEDRPELAARATYEVERARLLRRASAALTSDCPSLFDDAR